MVDRFDVLIVGSGFGGSVMAYRLAKKGYRVLVMERGKRWQPDEYPRTPDDQWFYDPDEPLKQHGWIDLRFMDDMIVAQGAGVGGGSLIYANVSLNPPPHSFDEGWPTEITYQELEPYYDEVSRILDLQLLPDNQLTERYKLMREAATKAGHSNRFSKVPLAVSFSEDWSYDLENPINSKHSKSFTNAFGRKQGTCVHYGNCDLGCDVQAKNTLDLNYLAGAEDAGAEIRPLHSVKSITPTRTGYTVHFSWLDLDGNKQVADSIHVAKVILAAGALGSTEILLRCRDQSNTLPYLSPKLGQGWSANGDFLTPACYEDREINPSQGPTISAAIDFLDGSQGGQKFLIEDGGIPDLRANYKGRKLRDLKHHAALKSSIKAIQAVMRKRLSDPPFEHWMPWFAQGIDAADGTLYLGRNWYAPWKRKLKLNWEIEKSETVIEAIIAMHKKLSSTTGASSVIVSPTWTVLKNLATPHPLGGCNMGENRHTGVVDHLGRVFGYQGLYVVDGAIIPEAIGLNPSKTIAALAERCAKHF